MPRCCGSSYRHAIDHDAEVAVVVPCRAASADSTSGVRSAMRTGSPVGRRRGRDVGGNVDVVFLETAGHAHGAERPLADQDA